MDYLLDLHPEDIWIICRTDAPPQCNDPRFWRALYERDFGKYNGPLDDSKRAYLVRFGKAALATSLAARARTWAAFRRLVDGLHLPQDVVEGIWQARRLGEIVLSRQYFENVPDDVIFEIGLDLHPSEIDKWCRVSRRFNHVVCNNPAFWRTKWTRNYGELKLLPGANWKQIYLYQNTLWSFGANFFGQLGLGHTRVQRLPGHVQGIRTRQVSCGSTHTAIIDTEHNIWVCGYNASGQLGLGTRRRVYDTFQQVPNIRAQQVSCGYDYTAAIDSDGGVWMWGSNSNGQLGLEGAGNRTTPVPLLHIQGRRVSCGVDHTAIIDTEHNIWMYGDNQAGQLGLGAHVDHHCIPHLQARQVSCGGVHTAAIDLKGNIWTWGLGDNGQLGTGDIDRRLTPTRVAAPSIRARQVSCGAWHTMVVDMNGTVWATGNNVEGQLGLGDDHGRLEFAPVSNIQARQVSCGEFHTGILGLNGDVWMCGANNRGQLGIDTAPSINYFSFQNLEMKAQQISCRGEHTTFIMTVM